MNEEFITNGIENDRYLKAVRLADQFETEMQRELENVAKEAIAERPALFVDDASPGKSMSRNRTTPLGHMRVDVDTRRVNSDGDHLTWNISIEWSQPEVHGYEEPSDRALCLLFYKMKNMARPEYDRVRQQTHGQSEWDAIQFGDDVWKNDRGIFAIPVSDGAGVANGLQTLKEHFFAFGESFGELPGDDAP